MRKAPLSRPVLAFHIIFGAYGFWLPNDPRGSWSSRVGSPALRPFGNATKTSSGRSVAHRDHDHASRLAAKQALAFPPVKFTGVQARAVARGIAGAVEQSAYVVHACAVMPDHVHLIVAHHRQEVRRMAAHFKSRGRISYAKSSFGPICSDLFGRKTVGRFFSLSRTKCDERFAMLSGTPCVTANASKTGSLSFPTKRSRLSPVSRRTRSVGYYANR